MAYRVYKKQEVVDLTRDAIHLFIKKDIEPFMAYLDEKFVWVGDYVPLFMKGRSNFYETIREECQAPPVEISQEEYTLLVHERHLWVTYGRFTATSISEGGDGPSSRIHFSFVWKQVKDELRLIHANACHAKDGVPQPDKSATRFRAAQSKIFEHIPETIPADVPEKIQLRDLNGTLHYLQYDDILYIQSDDKICHVVTNRDSFVIRSTLKKMEHPIFLQLHRSYLVNMSYIKEIRRYHAILSDGTRIPIGRLQYMKSKERLHLQL